MKKIIFAFVLAVSVFMMMGCNPTVDPDNGGNETPTWTYPVAKEDILRMRVQTAGNKVYLHVWKNDGNNGRVTEENNISGYRFNIYNDDTFDISPMYYNANPDNYHLAGTTPLYNVSDYEDFVDDVLYNPAVAGQYNLPVIDGYYTGHEDEVAELWDLLDLINDFYVARMGHAASLTSN